VTQPITRDLREIISAAETIEAELLFQVDRLKQRGAGSTTNESEHLMDLRQGYEYAARYIAILRRYQQGRLERQGAEREPVGAAAIDDAGRAIPFTETEAR
jgi:hypothetical protein